MLLLFICGALIGSGFCLTLDLSAQNKILKDKLEELKKEVKNE